MKILITQWILLCNQDWNRVQLYMYIYLQNGRRRTAAETGELLKLGSFLHKR